MRHFLCTFAIVTLVMAGAAHAQTERYSSWSNPNAQQGANSDLDRFIDELNTLIDEAERARAADPVFLQDLRNLANGSTQTWTKTVLDDSFADGNYTQNPRWQVLSGEYFIESGWGLRNRLATATSQNTQPSTGDPGADLAAAVLGQILQRATNTPSAPTTQTTTTNAIATSVRISNAFAISAEVSSWVDGGELAIGVFQGTDANIGYRVLYRSGRPVQLVRIGSSGTSVVAASASPLSIEDKEFHAIDWTRGTDGLMRVSVDGTEVISVADRGFSDPFDGIRLSNPSGDFIVRRITARGN